MPEPASAVRGVPVVPAKEGYVAVVTRNGESGEIAVHYVRKERMMGGVIGKGGF